MLSRSGPPSEQEDGRIMSEILAELPPGTAAALIRFYVLGERAANICEDLGITSVEFEKAKSYAKTRFEERTKPGAGSSALKSRQSPELRYSSDRR